MVLSFRNSVVQYPHPYNKIGDGPEGPECRIVRDWLHKFCKGKQLISFENLNMSIDIDFLNKNLPLNILSITSKGKHIIWTLTTNKNNKENVKKTVIYFHNHLGMTGRWTSVKSKHSRIQLKFSDDTTLYFDDVRKYGKFNICSNDSELSNRLKNVGIDLMDLTISYFSGNVSKLKNVQIIWYQHFEKMKKRKRSASRKIYPVLLEQKHFAGIGNYLVAEILYSCKISPFRLISQLSESEIISLFNSTVEILYKSYSSGGLTINDFWDPEGRIGKFKKVVYNSTHDPLGNKVQKDKFSNGRTCHWVPNIQK